VAQGKGGKKKRVLTVARSGGSNLGGEGEVPKGRVYEEEERRRPPQGGGGEGRHDDQKGRGERTGEPIIAEGGILLGGIVQDEDVTKEVLFSPRRSIVEEVE